MGMNYFLYIFLHFGMSLDSYETPLFRLSSAACARRPPEVRYGLVRFHTLRHGDRARYKCNPGFELRGDTYLTCLHGKWTGNVPTCLPGNAARFKRQSQDRNQKFISVGFCSSQPLRNFVALGVTRA